MNSAFSQPQSVCVLGAGESGGAAARLLASEGFSVTVLDSAPAESLASRAADFESHGIKLRAGDSALSGFSDFSFAVLSPGIDPQTALVRACTAAGVPIVGELELAYERCKCPVVGITGTNGKTTTTQLVEAMFNGAGVPTLACGNIGPAFSARVQESSRLAAMTVEVSSFQLETIRTFRPRISVWLNFAQDHLDRYADMEEYFAAKVRIFENQTPDDWAVVNARDSLPKLHSRVLRFSAYETGADFELRDGTILFRGEPVLSMAQTRLRGSHNAENLMAALGVGHAWGLSWDAMRAPLCAYQALPHRCELVRTIRGVEFVNDSKATNLDALEKALLAESKTVVLIAGGKDKGFEFESVTDLVARRCRGAVLIGEMAARIERIWGDALPCTRAASLADAVTIAASIAQSGDVVLFSPGTSSFDMFRNYADRGNQFRALVHELSS